MRSDLSGTIFPLEPGSYWTYQTLNSGIAVGNPYMVAFDVIPFPTEITTLENRHYYLDPKDVDRVRNYGPAPVWMTTDGGIFQADYGYLANDTMVVIAQEYGDRYDGTGMLVESEDEYIPLNPVVGRSYAGLGGAVYMGTENVLTPVWSGPAHIFESDDSRFVFVEDIGLVSYTFERAGFPFSRQELQLIYYRIGP